MTFVWSLLKSFILSVGGDIIKSIWKALKKPPEVKQREEDYAKVKNNLDAINSNSDGFILPPDAVNDKWGATIAEVEPRVESSKTDATKR